MVLKGLALGATVAAVAVAFMLVFTFQPTGTTLSTPSSNLVVMPNGVVMPQLQPIQHGGPALVEGNVSMVSLLRSNLDHATSAALDAQQRMTKHAPLTSNALSSQALMSCGGK